MRHECVEICEIEFGFFFLKKKKAKKLREPSVQSVSDWDETWNATQQIEQGSSLFLKVTLAKQNAPLPQQR